MLSTIKCLHCAVDIAYPLNFQQQMNRVTANILTFDWCQPVSATTEDNVEMGEGPQP